MSGTNLPDVYRAIHGVMAAMSTDGIAKDRKNEQQKFMFRGIDDVMNALSAVLVQEQLLMLPEALEHQCVERVTKNGAVLFFTTVKMRYVMVSAIDGSRHEVTVYGEAQDSGDKSTNKALSVAYKYAALQAFCIPTQGLMPDSDADAPVEVDAANTSFAREREHLPKHDRARAQPEDGPDLTNGVPDIDPKVQALYEVLDEASKQSKKAFNRVWQDNPGPARLVIYNNQDWMAQFNRQCAEADRAEGDA